MAGTPEVGEAKRRVVDELKRRSPCTTRQIAESLGISDVAARQHLTDLEARGLLSTATAPPSGRGRPRTLWSLTPLAVELFPDRHDDLTVELIGAIREAFGDEGLDRVVAARSARQLAQLRRRIEGESSVDGRVELLAQQRTAEGYMAEVRSDGDALLLIEHHCPVCSAAEACQQLCSAELGLFRDALGDDVEVERTDHLLSGDQRCVYRIRGR